MSSDFSNIANKTDIDQLNDLMRLRKDLMTFIGTDNLIKYVTAVIDSTDKLEFRSDHARKYIDKKKPVFILKMKDLVINNKTKDESYLNQITDDITRYVNDNLITKIGDYFKNALETNEELKEAYDFLSEEIRHPSFINVYLLKVNPSDNYISLSYYI